MDILRIHHLEVWTHIGVPEEERRTAQRVLVSVAMGIDTRGAAAADDIEQSIDYQKVAGEILALATTERKTIERFAEDIAEMILKKFEAVEVTVTVEKFSLADAESASITITRR